MVAGEVFYKNTTNTYNNTSPKIKPSYNLCQQYGKLLPSPICSAKTPNQQEATSDYYIYYLDNKELRKNGNKVALDEGNGEKRPIIAWRDSRGSAWKTNPYWKEITIDPTKPNRVDCQLDCESIGASIVRVAEQFTGDDGARFYPNRRIACASYASWVLYLARALPGTCEYEPLTDNLVRRIDSLAHQQNPRVQLIYKKVKRNYKNPSTVLKNLKPGDYIAFTGTGRSGKEYELLCHLRNK